MSDTPRGFIIVSQAQRHSIHGNEIRIATADIERYHTLRSGYTALYIRGRDMPIEVYESPQTIDAKINLAHAAGGV